MKKIYISTHTIAKKMRLILEIFIDFIPALVKFIGGILLMLTSALLIKFIGVIFAVLSIVSVYKKIKLTNLEIKVIRDEQLKDKYPEY